jgi:hypothetical protein
MTTAGGTYAYCDETGQVSLVLQCFGPGCPGLAGNLTCKDLESGRYSSNNNVSCSGNTSIVSNFTISQSNVNVIQNQSIIIDGTKFIFQQDEGANVTVANATTSAVPFSVQHRLLHLQSHLQDIDIL